MRNMQQLVQNNEKQLPTAHNHKAGSTRVGVNVNNLHSEKLKLNNPDVENCTKGGVDE
jgi:hypothetical protein